jgi:starch synthase
MQERKLKVLIVSPEVVPFAKTGGLADVSGALPKALASLGHQIKVILPKYKMVDDKEFTLKELTLDFPDVKVGEKKEKIGVKSCNLKNSQPEYLFVVNEHYFEREELYKDPETGFDYKDNDERFIFFAQGILEILKSIGWQPEIIHCNDWQSALIPAYLKTVYASDPFFKNTVTVFSIHNIAYQGNFPKETFKKIGVKDELFYPTSPFEYWGNCNFLKIGISYADVINTVSQQYMMEIQTSKEFGYGMEGILRTRSNDLYGVLNGIDYQDWNPEIDKLIPFNYSPEDLSGKKKNKEHLLKQSGLPVTKKDIPLIGMISRLADQKGFDLLAQIKKELMKLNLKLVILGTGERKYHDLLKNLEKKYPRKLKVHLLFDNKLAHLIEAGADMYLMPSRYEPCGLNQLYSLKYGTVPIVRETGGLADTIQNYDPEKEEGTGFVFKNYDPDELLKVIKRALKVYQDKKKWKKLMLSGMQKDFSWEISAKKYIQLYQKALDKLNT